MNDASECFPVPPLPARLGLCTGSPSRNHVSPRALAVALRGLGFWWRDARGIVRARAKRSIVVLPYGFGGPSSEGSHDVSMPFAIPAAPMSQKRRRADDAGDEISTHALAWETQRNQQYGSPAFANGTDAIAQQQYTAVESTGSGANAGVSTSMSEHAGANNPYPDVSSYSQPYFYQQTHPSTYNSPWPPNGATRFAPQSNTYPQPSSVSAAATDMPFFPSQAPTETGEAGFDVADVQQQQLVPAFTPDSLNAPPFVYASRNEHGLARSDVPPEASAFSYEDASMHLKIQSLPILENLVRSAMMRTRQLHMLAAANSSTGHSAHPHYMQS